MQKRKYDITDYQELNRKKNIIKNELDLNAARLRSCQPGEDLYYLLGGRCEHLEQVIRSLQRECSTTRKCVASVPDPVQRDLLQLRYIDFQTWEMIADETAYSLRNVYRIKAKALRAYQVAVAGHQRTPK